MYDILDMYSCATVNYTSLLVEALHNFHYCIV